MAVNLTALELNVLVSGSLNAACQLVQKLHATVLECLVIMELVDLKGRENVRAPVHSLLQF
jgi:adenine/guanine phosphoribosyltransferase-like PRPP-binding protein